MYFQSLRELALMDGHGGFVWSAYGVAVAVLLLLLVLPRRRERRVLSELRADLRRHAQAGGTEEIVDASQA